LREWLKQHTPPSQKSSSNAQDNHDAFEWMIMHVVLPNTAAAKQPRYSGSDANKDGGTEKIGSTSRLKLGRSSNTILEKIKADFNVSSKSAPDRVAQIRLQTDDVPQALLPQKPAAESGHIETPQDRINAWNDVVTKFRTLILSSFDLRVRQYEDDIRERGAQRMLPGWNFCTFFVLKEGLARGFESVGLLDDALLGYDELSIELDSVIREQGVSAGFLPSTSGFKELLDEASASNAPSYSIWSAENRPISAARKNYRELILGNNISIFDFKCYVFARQKDVLLRMGILHSSEIASIRQDHPTTPRPGEHDNLSSLSELCRRTAAFAASVSRVLREDLEHEATASSAHIPDSTIANIIASWTYAVAAQILDETSASTLTSQIETLGSSFESFTSSSKPKPLGHPPRSSSLSGRSIEAPYENIPENARVIFESLKSVGSPTEAAGPLHQAPLEELAGHRAELYILQRQVLERLAVRIKWPVGWIALQRPKNCRQSELQEVGLDDDAETSAIEDESAEDERPSTIIGLCVSPLVDAMQSVVQCRNSYKDLTTSAISHYLAARHTKAVERLMADLAVLRFQDGDFTGAAILFGRITPFYAERQWSLIEAHLLNMHAQCLKKLHRRDDYVRMLLNLLSKCVAQRKASRQLRLRLTRSTDPWLSEESIDDEGIITEVLAQSEELPYELTVPMEHYFAEITVDPFIRHFPDTDGFQVRVKFRHLLNEPMTFQKVKLLLRSVTSGIGHEIWLESEDPVEVKSGAAAIVLSSHITTYGVFNVEKAVFTANKVSFVHDTFLKAPSPKSRDPDSSPKQQTLSILCYPRSDAFNANISHCRNVHIERTKTVEIECSSGLNQIEHAKIELRSATAGLRIRTADANVVQGDAELSNKRTPGVLEITDFNAHSSIRIRVPYGLEGDQGEIAFRLHVTYKTPAGTFEFLSVPTVPVGLALEVNVHDVFKSDFLYSKFIIRPATNLPLTVQNMQLNGTSAFEVESPPHTIMPMIALPQQPATALYKISQKAGEDGTTQPRKPADKEEPLILHVRYQCIEEALIERMKQLLRRDMVDSELENLSRLLEFSLVERTRQALTSQDYMDLIILQELDIPSFAALRWDSLLAQLPGPVAEAVLPWLQSWHKKHSKIVHEDTKGDKLDRGLAITVPVPRQPILHTVALSVPKTTPIFKAGAMIQATLTVSHTRRWDGPDALKEYIIDKTGSLDFILELDAPTDLWLIGGLRRSRFSAKENEIITYPIMLIPLKPGRLLLPSVDVRMASRDIEGVGSMTDYRNMGDALTVINDVGSSTVSLKEGFQGTEAMIVTVEGRRAH
jgi:trafficking protein particle complex subunit 10